jgi:hypothetical protein
MTPDASLRLAQHLIDVRRGGTRKNARMTKHSSIPAALAELERRRVRALVAADVAVADELHARDFQLITPCGETRSKADYLGRIASGRTDYQLWEPGEIKVRVRGDVGCVRYRSTMNVIVDGRETGPRRLWHTDYYEQDKGLWRVVWSQATTIRT